MRFQIQEMARVEKLTTDAEIQVELDIYNPMVPDPGQLCATMFLELTSDEQMREWLPKLANVERSVVSCSRTATVCGHRSTNSTTGLTREEVTAAVHYLRWEFTPIRSLRSGRPGPARDRSSRRISRVSSSASHPGRDSLTDLGG